MKRAIVGQAAKGNKWAGFLLVAGILYGVSPIDAIPDIIPLIGIVDDVVIVPTLLYMAYRQYQNRKRLA